MSSKKTRFLASLLIIIVFAGIYGQSLKAQKLKTLASNTFNGAMTGGILGGATMALQNSEQLDPVRFGVGLGTLGGLAIGAHDVAQSKNGQQYLIDGTFNRGNATTVIILLDSIYGAATGALVGTSINLMVDEPLVNGLQYGVGAGTWGGFLFGLVDAFYLSSIQSQPVSILSPDKNAEAPAQWLTINEQHTRISFLQPQLYSFKKVNPGSIQQKTGVSLSMVEFRVNF